MTEHDRQHQADHGVVMSTAGADGPHLVLAGALDDSAVERLRALLDDVVGPGVVVRVDLSHVTRLPLGVLQALAVGHRQVLAGGGRLVVFDPSPAASRALRTSGLDRALQVDAHPPAGAVVLAEPGSAVS